MNGKFLYTTVCAAVLLTLPCAAQNTNHFTYHFGGGWTEPMKATGVRLDRGFNLGAGAGVNVVPEFGVTVDFGSNRLGVNPTTLASVGVPGGSARIYSLTLQPVVRLGARHRFNGYITAGGGFYRRTVEFTEPSVQVVTGFDPFFGAFFPVAIPVNTVLGSFTQNRGGVNAGAGIQVGLHGDSNAKFFMEGKYHYMYSSPRRTTFLPVTFGFRW